MPKMKFPNTAFVKTIFFILSVRTLVKLFGMMLLLSITFSWGCKKDENTENPPAENLSDEALAFKNYQMLNYASERMIAIGESLNVHPPEALYHVWDELLEHEDIESVEYTDTSYLKITTTGGYSSIISLTQVDEDSISIYRGGNGISGQLEKFTGSAEGSCSNLIPNKKVLLFAASHDEFYEVGNNEFETKVVDRILSLEPQAEITTYKDEECNPDLMETFDQYGLVIIDAHGERDGVYSGMVIRLEPTEIPESIGEFQEILKTKLGSKHYDSYLNKRLHLGTNYFFKIDNPPQETYDSYKNGFYSDHAIILTSKGIRELLPKLNNTVLFANNCYSGHGNGSYSIVHKGKTYTYQHDGVGDAWMDRDPISLYAYRAGNGVASYKTENDWCKQNADTLIQSLFGDKDSTAIAHLINKTTEISYPYNRSKHGRLNYGPLIFKHFGEPDWCYGCSAEPPYMTATLDGILANGQTTYFNMQGNVAGSVRNGQQVTVYGLDGNRSFILTTSTYEGPGTYSITEGGSEWTGSFSINGGLLGQWIATTGAITITDDCDTFIKGTFYFNGETSSGNQATFSDGDFLVNF